MLSSIQKINKLLINELLPLIDNDYVCLDLPGHFNVGDILIAEGMFRLLKKTPHKCLYKSTSMCCNLSLIPEYAIILMLGGGNFGDLYPGSNNLRLEVVKRFPNNKIIFLPQTITYNDRELIKKHANIFKQHSDLIIIARDICSYEFIQQNFQNNKLLLLPDTAFGLYDILPKKLKNTNQCLYFKRKDFELGEECLTDNITFLDWDDILNTSNFKVRLFFLKIISKLRRLSKNRKFLYIQNIYTLKIIYPYCIRKSVRCFLEYDEVYTTRLHGAILCTLLHIPFSILDTPYKKINNYFDTWFNTVNS